MKQANDAIYIITETSARADELKRTVVLRGYDEILCIPYEGASVLLKANPPALLIVDMEGETEKTVRLMEQLSATVRSLVLAEAFDESLFVTCHDHGARDFIVKPVEEAYLVSRIIRALQEHRLEQSMLQKDRILVEMGVLSPHSGVFTTPYLLKVLKQQAETISPYGEDALSLLILQMEGYQSPLPEALAHELLATVGGIIRESARGFDMAGEYFSDKFAVILPHTGRRGAKALANRLLNRLHGMPIHGASGSSCLEVRIGIAEYAGCRQYEELINRAFEDLKGGEPKKAEIRSGGNALHQI